MRHIATLCAAALVAVPASCLPAAEVVLPSVAVDVLGRSTEMELPTPVHFSTEVRVTNLSGTPKGFSVVDWIGTCGFAPTEHTVEPGVTLSLGGWSLFGHRPGEPLPPCAASPVYGMAVAEADEGLLVQTSLLSSPLETRPTPAVIRRCESWEGGLHDAGLPLCNPGSGPVVENDRGFFPPGTPLLLPWLQTDDARRTNLILVNPDETPSVVTVTVTSGDGSLSAPRTIPLSPRAYFQINNVFAEAPWTAVRERNRETATAAARALVRSTGRLYAVAYVLSNYDGGLGICLPRPVP